MRFLLYFTLSNATLRYHTLYYVILRYLTLHNHHRQHIERDELYHGLRNSKFISLVHKLIQSARPSLLSNGDSPSRMKFKIDSLHMLPSVKFPLESPSVPWAIICFPDTCMMLILHLACILTSCNSTINSKSKGV